MIKAYTERKKQHKDMTKQLVKLYFMLIKYAFLGYYVDEIKEDISELKELLFITAEDLRKHNITVYWYK